MPRAITTVWREVPEENCPPCQIRRVITPSIHKVCQDLQKEIFVGSKVNPEAEIGNNYITMYWTVQWGKMFSELAFLKGNFVILYQSCTNY